MIFGCSYLSKMKHMIFGCSYLSKTVTFLEDLSQAFYFLKESISFTTLIAAIYPLKYCKCCFCHRKNNNHPFFELLFIYFQRRTCGHPLFGSFLQQYYVYFQKKLVPAMCTVKGSMIICMEYLQPSILLTVWYIFLILKCAGTQFWQSRFFQRVSEHQLL